MRFHRMTPWLGLAALGLLAACQEQTPTSIDEDLLPDEPVTVEIRLPWADFASNLEVFGGYGAPRELGTGVVARAFAGSLDARTLVRFGPYPRQVSVRDTTGTTRPDSMLTYVGGRVVARFDTIASTNGDTPVELALGATSSDWDAGTVTWTIAVDTLRDERAWAEPGAGPVTALGTALWDPTVADSVTFPVDSAMVAAWADVASGSAGARIELRTAGFRLQLNNVYLRLDTRPSLNPDTIIELIGGSRDLTFVYDPFPDPPPDGIRVGGAPAWRTVFDVAMPARLTGPPALCAAVGCPVSLGPDQLNYAALLLRSSRTQQAFQPTDTVGVDVRPVLLRAALPKAPLGNSLVGALGRRVRPEAFGDQEGTTIEIPITPFARDLLVGPDAAGRSPPNTLALLSPFEPISISFATFHGPGGPLEPVLKLIVTVGKAVELP